MIVAIGTSGVYSSRRGRGYVNLLTARVAIRQCDLIARPRPPLDPLPGTLAKRVQPLPTSTTRERENCVPSARFTRWRNVLVSASPVDCLQARRASKRTAFPSEPGSLAGATCSFRLRLLIAYKHDARARELRSPRARFTRWRNVLVSASPVNAHKHDARARELRPPSSPVHSLALRACFGFAC